MSEGAGRCADQCEEGPGKCASAAAGYKLKLIMPANMSEERRAAMAAYGAELVSVPAGKMELARDLAHEMQVQYVVSIDYFQPPRQSTRSFKTALTRRSASMRCLCPNAGSPSADSAWAPGALTLKRQHDEPTRQAAAVRVP